MIRFRYSSGNEVDTVLSHARGTGSRDMFQPGHDYLRSAIYRDGLDTGRPPCEVYELAVMRWKGLLPSVVRDSTRGTAGCRHLPNLISTSTVRSKVNPLPVLRPRGEEFSTGFKRDLTRSSTLRGNHKDLG